MLYEVITAKDTLWPQGIQFQIKEGATGDFILLQNVTLEQNGARNEPGRSVVISKSENAENAAGEWNQIEIKSLLPAPVPVLYLM